LRYAITAGESTMNDKVPFLDLVTPHREMEDELVAVFRDALKTGQFIGGPMVEEFEREFAVFCGSKYAVGVGSGTDALRFALIAAGIKKGDIVITVPNTFIATTEAISQAGADPEFIDIDEKTYNLDPEKLREFLSGECKREAGSGRTIHKKTGRPVTAVIPVHLYGQIADMDRIMETAEEYQLLVFEDACQAHGAEYFSKRENRWKRAGTMGIAAAFSFYPGKNLGACGEAGAVTTNDESMAKTIRMIRDHGQAKKYYHDIEGYNGRLDAIQAGILRTKLKRLAAWNADRRQIAKRYHELLSTVPGVVIPYEPESSRAVYHLYVIRAKRRDTLQSFLSARNIFSALHYPVPLHRQKAYAASKYHNGSLAVSERAAAEILSLPMFPGLTEEQQARVVDGIREFLGTQQQTVRR
jgi:dTDP-4-amino-4,6-dideoxygalactose transaminase